MSKQIKAEISCQHCGVSFEAHLYRSLWVEDPENRALIADDRVNFVTCPSCKAGSQLEFPFLCTNVKRGFALWYEPYPDPEIDKDILLYTKRLGPDSFYVSAPRLRTWEEFKAKLLELEAQTDTAKLETHAPPQPHNAETAIKHSEPTREHKGYPRRLSHLQKASNRLWYSLILATMLVVLWISFVLLDVIYLYGDLSGIVAGIVVVGLVCFTPISFVVLTVIHFFCAELKPWRQRSKGFRIYWFGFACWFVFVLLAVVLIDPFDYRGLPWFEGEMLHFLGVSVLTPILVGIALYGYERLIK